MKRKGFTRKKEATDDSEKDRLLQAAHILRHQLELVERQIADEETQEERLFALIRQSEAETEAYIWKHNTNVFGHMAGA